MPGVVVIFVLFIGRIFNVHTHRKDVKSRLDFLDDGLTAGLTLGEADLSALVVLWWAATDADFVLDSSAIVALRDAHAVQ